METARIGAYGGTFDPIHRGHVDVASAILEKFDMDELLIVPAASPPHKDPRGLSSSHHRFAMAAIATLGVPGVRVSAIEIDSPANPYTFQTVGRLRARYGQRAELYFIVGSDSFQEMHTWRRPDLILSNCNLIVATRPGYGMSNQTLTRPLGRICESGPGGQEDHTAPSSFGYDQFAKIVDLTAGGSPFGNRGAERLERPQAGFIFLTDYVRADVSSTEIRRRAAQNLDIQGMVPQGVAEYIRKYELYKAGPPADSQ